ncbi:MAG: hypothetical protein IMZ61_06750 [Planctomycetes bacterium]|nr:hypothetical protein [Planctomycetota bacterium]
MNTIPENSKFAGLSMYGTGASLDFPDTLSFPGGLIVTKTLPFEVTPWWREQLGRLICDELENSDLFLLAVAPSTKLSVLDQENLLLEDRCRNLFYGLLLSTAMSSELAPQMVTGSMESGKATFRQIGRFEQPRSIAGTPAPDLDQGIVEEAASYAAQIETITNQQGRFGRAVWALNCFLNSVTSSHVYERVRNSVRTIEAFLLPSIGKTERQFKFRTELFVGPKEHPLVETIYSIRSRIEHLHDPLSMLPGSSINERHIALFEISTIAEAIARHCLQRFLNRRQLLPHFENDSNIESFWKLPSTERRQLWGDPVDVASVRKSFDRTVAQAVIA